jgi:hypothetical protein
MKNLKFVLGVLLSLVMFSACSNDDESGIELYDPEVIFGDSSNAQIRNGLTGHLRYNEYNNSWTISYCHPGTYDSVEEYYPLNLPAEFKTDKEGGMDVSFSGKIAEMTDKDIQTLRIILLGGHRYYFVYLTDIELIN